MRSLTIAVVAVLALTGCTTTPREEQALAGASIDGTIAIGDAFVLKDARLSVAPINAAGEGTPGRAVELEDPPWTARTAMLRDHWVLEATLAERAPQAGAGVHRVRLDWNGERAGEVFVGGQNATRALAVIVRFDVGASIERSNVYAFEIARVP